MRSIPPFATETGPLSPQKGPPAPQSIPLKFRSFFWYNGCIPEKDRDEMKGYQVYSKVHQMREAGFSQRAAAKALGINRKTVKRYWDMDVDEYEHNARKIVRIRNLDSRRDRSLPGSGSILL